MFNQSKTLIYDSDHLLFIVILAACSLFWTEPSWSADAPADFEQSIAPLFNNRCLECHNTLEKAGGLDLSHELGLKTGGDTGAILDAKNPLQSLILDRVSKGEMPPKKQGKNQQLSPEEQSALRAWIEAGTPWPKERHLDRFETTSATRGGRDWWSLRPIQKPEVSDANPIDALIRRKLDEHGWNPAPEADERTLIRRLSIDLTGIPPSAEEIDAFVKDDDPKAYEHLVDKLLASPHFGERWGRHWLDLARYAETSGYERDQPKPFAWKYRDWVVQAFNDDLPFNRFVLEQLAGDELPDRSESSLIATGFLRLGTWNDEPNDPQEYKYERLEDIVHTTSTAFLGLTVKCARCHDHKFDPIRQDDYYKMAAAFWAGPIQPSSSGWLGGPDPKLLPSDILGWTDLGREPPPLHLLKKGEPNRPGPVVAPGPLSILPALDRPFSPPSETAKTSERRLQLARWIIDPANPLTARVWVNRLWQQHMGEGLVRSPDNFGFTGEKPTHPELLDWLAATLIETGWKSKPLHKLIVMSNTYRQASIHPKQAEYEQVDAGNHLWWRAERRRLDAESLRDTLLFASGKLDLKAIGGPSFLPTIPPDALEGLSTKDKAWTPSPPEQQNRRALYIYAKRGLLSPFMTAFDFPDTTLPCGRRDVTLVAPQALTLLNNAFVHDLSDALAATIEKTTEIADARVDLAWRKILGRDPSAKEHAQSIEHIQRQTQRFSNMPNKSTLALASLCQVLMNSNEFLFVD